MTNFTEFMPDYFKIVPVGEQFFIFILLDPKFADEVIDYYKSENGFPTELRTEIGGKCLIVSTVSNKIELHKMFDTYEGLSRGYMGKYKAFAIAFVTAYKEIPDSIKRVKNA